MVETNWKADLNESLNRFLQFSYQLHLSSQGHSNWLYVNFQLKTEQKPGSKYEYLWPPIHPILQVVCPVHHQTVNVGKSPAHHKIRYDVNL